MPYREKNRFLGLAQIDLFFDAWTLKTLYFDHKLDSNKISTVNFTLAYFWFI